MDFWNIPIMPSDILMEATTLGFPGQVAILIPAGGLGIFPFLQRPPGVFTDNLDALQIYSTPMRDPRLVDWIEWESFILGGDPEAWLPEGTIQEWDDKTLPSSATLPEGPLDPNLLVNNLNDFRRGDSNEDGQMDMSDAVFTLYFLFLGTAAPACQKAADTNDSGDMDLSDPVYTLMFLFTGGEAPPAPYPGCGPDGKQDNLRGTSYSKC